MDSNYIEAAVHSFIFNLQLPTSRRGEDTSSIHRQRLGLLDRRRRHGHNLWLFQFSSYDVLSWVSKLIYINLCLLYLH